MLICIQRINLVPPTVSTSACDPLENGTKISAPMIAPPMSTATVWVNCAIVMLVVAENQYYWMVFEWSTRA